MILVTGGAGYIGSITTAKLVRQGRDVCVYDNLSRGYRDAAPAGALFRHADLADRAEIERLFAELPIEAVLHFAAYIVVEESVRDPAIYFSNNVSNGLNLLQAAQSAGVRRFVFSSTAAVYNDADSAPLTENSPVKPANPYGESKLMFEQALEWYRKIHRTEAFTFRYFNVCGADGPRGERSEPKTHLIPSILESAAGKRESVVVHGDDYPTADGSAIRDFIDVNDLADAHIAALDAPAELAGRYNLGVGRGHSVKEVIAVAEGVTGRRIPSTVGPRRNGDAAVRVSDPTLANRRLGWKAERTLEEALQSSWEFMQRRVSAALSNGSNPGAPCPASSARP